MERQPFLADETVELYPPEKQDADRLRNIVNHPDLRAWVNTWTPVSLESEQAWIQQVRDDDDRTMLVVMPRGEDEIVGTVEINRTEKTADVAEFGTMILPEYQSRGFGTAAASLILGHAFGERDLHKVWARALAGNDPSIGLLEKLGFSREGRLREHGYRDGQYRDMIMFGLLKREWQARGE